MSTHPEDWSDEPAQAGQVSTAEWQNLQALQSEADQKPREEPVGSPITGWIDRMLADLPDEHEQADLPGAEPVAVPRPKLLSLMTVHGWPKRYVDPIELIGDKWKTAYELALPVVEAGGILILHGKRGNGKTRMSAEIARCGRYPHDEVKGRGPAGAPVEPRRTPLYRTAMEFFVDVRATYRKNSEVSEKDVIAQLASVGLLVLDELQERGDTPFEDRLLTHLIDKRYAACLPTILISNHTQAELGPALGTSVVDRYRECGRRIEFDWESYRGTRR